MTKAEWERHHTVIRREGDAGAAYVDNSDPNSGYDILFWAYGTATDNSPIYFVSADLIPVLSDTLHIPTTFDVTHPVGGDLQRQAVVALLPADAQLVKTEPGVGQLGENVAFADTFHSASLEKRYPPLALIQDPWGTDPPGTIHVEYISNGPPLANIQAGSDRVPQATPTPYPAKTPYTPNPKGVNPPTDIPTVPRPVPSMPWLITPSPMSATPVAPSAQRKAPPPPESPVPAEPAQPKPAPVTPTLGGSY